MNYLIMSTSNRIIKDEIKKIMKNDNKEIYHYSDLDLKDFMIDFNTIDLFGTEKYYLIYDAKFNKTDLEKWNDILKSDNPNHIIFISYEKTSVPANTEAINKLNLNFNDYKPMALDYLKKSGYKISNDDLFYIMDTCLYNYDLILNELDKLMLYYNEPTTFKTVDVKKIVSKNIVDNTNKLFDAILKKDYPKINKIYHDLRLLKIDNYAITAILGKNFSDYLIVKELENKNTPVKDMVKKTGLKEYQVNNYLKYSNAFSNSECEEYLRYLANIDYELKQGLIKEEHALDQIFIEI